MNSFNFYLFPILLAAASAMHQQWQPYSLQMQQNMQPMMQYILKSDQQYQPSEYTNPGYDFAISDDQNQYDGQGQFDGGQGQFEGGQGHFDGQGHFGGHDLKPHSYPVHEHVEETNPEEIKHYKEVVVPIPRNVEFKVNQPIIIPVPHPVPIQVPVPKAVVIPIIKEVSIPVEKSVPYPVHKTVHVPKIKEVPFEVVKHIIVPVEKPVPFKVPVYETIIHSKKGSHKI